MNGNMFTWYYEDEWPEYFNNTKLKDVERLITELKREMTRTRNYDLIYLATKKIKKAEKQLKSEALVVLKLSDPDVYEYKLYSICRQLSYVKGRFRTERLIYNYHHPRSERYYIKKDDYQKFRGKTKHERKQYRLGNIK